MAYVRKTVDEFDIEQKTCQGWEVVSSEESAIQARRALREYRENQPQYSVRFKKRCVKIKEVR